MCQPLFTRLNLGFILPGCSVEQFSRHHAMKSHIAPDLRDVCRFNTLLFLSQKCQLMRVTEFTSLQPHALRVAMAHSALSTTRIYKATRRRAAHCLFQPVRRLILQ